MISTALMLFVLSAGPGCSQSQPIQAGSKASCSGIIFPDDWAKRAGENHLKVEQLQLQLSECQNVSQISDKACAEKLKALEKIANAYNELASKALEPEPQPQWYLNPMTTGSAGFLVGLVVGIYVVNQK